MNNVKSGLGQRGLLRASWRAVASPLTITFTLILTATPAQAAGPPLISDPGTPSGVSTQAATLKGSVDPAGTRTFARFAYVTQAQFVASEFAEAQKSEEVTLQATVKGKGDLTKGSDTVTGFETTVPTFAVGQELKAPALPGAIPAGTTITKVITDPQSGEVTELRLSKDATATAVGVELTATGPQPFAAHLEGLSPQTVYRFRIEAENTKGESATGPERVFATYGLAPTFGPCPNEIFRSGEFSPLDHPASLLPDCRAYEQATPVEKDGNDAYGAPGFIRAASGGGGITFMTSSGVPGGEGAQAIPPYLALRDAGESGWTTGGLFPPGATGNRASLLGWTADFSRSYAEATQLGQVPEAALFLRRGNTGPPQQITPYIAGNTGSFAYVGSSDDGSLALFEARAALPGTESEGAIDGASNLYAYDESTGQISLAGQLNTLAETEAALPKGSVGGFPSLFAFVQQARTVSDDGSVFFTANGSGQLYQRINPTASQSPINGEGKCTDPALACTLQLSATHREPPDTTGSAPARFEAASADGKIAYFSSSEKLTADANTGPEQPAAQIGRADLSAPDPNATKEESFIPARAIGLAVDPSETHIYWADPIKGTIGRANIDGTHRDDEFIVAGETEAENHPGHVKEGVMISAPSTPRYVAVDAGHVYWTNTGPLGENVDSSHPGQEPLLGGGTIGRATLDSGGEVETVDPEFIKGATNPQGIAVDSAHIYWANDTQDSVHIAVARAPIVGGAFEPEFVRNQGGALLYGLAVDGEHLYFVEEEPQNDNSYVLRSSLAGEKETLVFVGKAGTRGLAVDSSHVYWAQQIEGKVGRADLNLKNPEYGFVDPQGAPLGLASAGDHLYWSVNGEIPPHPGNDLYRYDDAAGALSDVTSDSTHVNGAEVQGVLGSTPDGSYLYFTANADLDGSGPAQAGDCDGVPGGKAPSGRCTLYLAHDDETSFVARLDQRASNRDLNDAFNWTRAGQEGGVGVLQRTSFIAADGTLVFRSSENQTPYDSQGVAEYYRYRPGEGTTCLTCDPTGAAPGGGPSLVSYALPGLQPLTTIAATQPHPLSGDGNRFFFESSEALVGTDVDGLSGCPIVGAQAQGFSSCQDVYEWEAPGSGSCTTSSSAYAPLNGGCIYLISPGDDGTPALFADASASGEDVYFFSREQLVGSDRDLLFDVYDARVGGGLSSQNPLSPPGCEGEGCMGPPEGAPATPDPLTPAVSSPGNPQPPHCKKPKRRQGGRCVGPKPQKHRHHTKQHRKHHGQGGHR